MTKFKVKKPEEYSFNDILFNKSDFIGTITINRPQAYNAYTLNTLYEMIEAIEDLIWDDNIAVIVITGSGDKAFSTGGDVKEYASDYITHPEEFWKWMGIFTRFHDLIRNSGKPVIARLNGMVAGGGNEINLSCDLAIAAEHVTIRQVGTSVGSVAAGGATKFLPLFLGDRRAREMLLLNEPVSAEKALEWGLVNYVVPAEELDSKVNEIAQKLVDKFPECTRYTKQQLNFWRDFAWNMTIGHAKEWLTLHFGSEETYEGMQGFVEKRKPDYIKIRKGINTLQCLNCGSNNIPKEYKYCGNCGNKL